MILAFEDNKALVKADVQDKVVYVSVVGSPTGRRRLLAIIRSDLERINSEITKLKPQAMVPIPSGRNVAVPYEKLKLFEARGIEAFPDTVNGEVVEINVGALLNGVDLDGARQNADNVDRPVRVFYSYSHKDEVLRDELETHLKLLHRTGLITEWHDRRIEAGGDWRQSIDKNLKSADLVLLLISADFIASDYCYCEELKIALDRHKDNKARVVPIIVRDVNWKSAPFGWIQALPKDAKPVTIWTNRDSAWREVSEGIQSLATAIRQGTRT